MQSENFQRLLRKAIGTERTQAEFAKIAGISPGHLNRLINSKEIKQPSIETLSKIARVADNGIVLGDLLKECGYKLYAKEPDDELTKELKDFDKEFKIRKPLSKAEQKRHTSMADELKIAVEETISALNKLDKCLPDMCDFVKALERRLVSDDYAFNISQEINNDKPWLKESSNAVIITADWATDNITSVVKFMIFYDKTDPQAVDEKPCLIIKDYAFSSDILVAYDAVPAELIKQLEKYGNLDICQICKVDTVSPEKRLLAAIFDDDEYSDETYSNTTELIGFITDSITNDIAQNFIKRHRNTYDALYDKINKIPNSVRIEEKHKNGYIIANIIASESDIRFNYMRENEDNEHGLIAVDPDDNNLPDNIINILKRYARELDIKTVGYYYRVSTYNKRKIQEFSVD